MKKFFTLIFLLSALLTAKSQSTTIVMSQIYGGGGATSGTPAYHDDYIELHNLSSSAVNLFTPNPPSAPIPWSIQYGSQNGNIGGSASSRILLPDNLTIPAGGYYLIQITSTGGTVIGPALPVTADLIVSANPAMSGTNGKLALLSDSTLLKCGQTNNTPTPCTLPIASLVDLVGYGKLPPSPTNVEGFVISDDSAKTVHGGTFQPATSLNSRVVAVRKNNGNQDTQNNYLDFDTIPNAIPRNSAFTTPVKLSLFAVQKVNSAVKISWATEQEFNSKNFVIERSANGRDWNAIATLDAAGNSNTKLNYSTIDNTPGKGLNYYRLKEIDIAGRFEYSPVKQLFFSTKFQVMVSPNPVKEHINIYISKNGDQATTIQLIDLNGKTVRSLSSTQSQVQISAAGLTKGVYVVKVTDENNVTTQKVVVE